MSPRFGVITIQTNGVGGKVPSSMVAINQHDPSRMTSITPVGPLKHRQMSMARRRRVSTSRRDAVLGRPGGGKGCGAPARPGVRRAHRRIRRRGYDSDLPANHRAKDRRVLILSNMKEDIPLMPTVLELMTGRYKEQVTWRDAATGRLLAESDFFEPLSPNCLITPGYGGRAYYPTTKGFITLQVQPVAAR